MAFRVAGVVKWLLPVTARRFWHRRVCDCQERLNGAMLARQGSSSVVSMAELQYNRRAFTAGMASLLCPVSLDLARAQQLEHSSLKLGVANRAHLYYLPVTIADRRGHFRDYGLTVTMSDFEGGGQAFDALLAGTVDVAAGAYEHTLRAQAMGQDVRAVIELGRFPGVVLAVGKDRPFKSIADLKGLKIGVTAPNSSSHFFVLYLMAKAGLAPDDVSFVGVGGGERAVEAMKTGEIDAISNLDPVITRLQQDGAIRIIVDSRLPRTNYDIFGGTNPAAVLYGQAGIHRRQSSHDAGAGQRVLQDAAMDRDRHHGRDRGYRAGRIFSRRPSRSTSKR